MKNHKTREGFEYWDNFTSIQRYSFIKGNDCVRKVKDSIGLHVEQSEVSELVDMMQNEINRLQAELAVTQSREYLDDVEHKIFKDIQMNGKPLSEHNIEFASECGNRRLYVERFDNKFTAHAVNYVSRIHHDSVDQWDSESLTVSTIFTVTAYYDGVRHLEFNRHGCDMDGYLYYPNMKDLVLMLQKIEEIEDEICTQT